MDLESYLMEQKYQILAISRISQILNQTINENYYEILKGKINVAYIEDIKSLITAIQIIAFGMRYYRRECYQEVYEDYKDDFSFSSTVFEDL